MAIHPIQSLSDPLLEAYRNMKDKELARDGKRFIAEGQNVVRRLLRSGLEVESVLIAERKRAAIVPVVPESVPLFTAGDDLIESIIGFEFHSGVLACGIRPKSPELAEVVPGPDRPAVIMICQEITNTENLGALIRIAAAFGADAMVLGERCCDPFFRQCVRVSMGSIFTLPIVRSADLPGDLDSLRKRFGVEILAATLNAEAEPLKNVQRIGRVGLVFGNEAQGLDASTVGHCDREVTIPMKLGTDSLNVAVAAAVFLFHLTDGGL
jgi:tRNA G18 (ribose-2'-O)-methylase SpoU